MQSCEEAPPPESDELKSLHIDFGWTFSGNVPNGTFDLKVNGQNFGGQLAGGVRIDRKLTSLTGSGELVITVEDGPILHADLELGMPNIQSALGLTQRLTNLGFYAGVNGEFDGRARWAVRAFKRARINAYSRISTVPENNDVTARLLQAVQLAYGVHPGDNINNELHLGPVSTECSPCGMFGAHTLTRGSFENVNTPDDIDADGTGNNGYWGGVRAANQQLPIAGIFPIYVRAFDPAAGDNPIPNRVNLPQPIRMTKFVLFELGYWLVQGTGGWTLQNGTETRVGQPPDGRFDRYMQWAVREFQCHAKLPNAAQEDLDSTEARYLPRLLFGPALAGIASYPTAGRVSGALNEATRDALQAWADEALRCPVVVVASRDNNNPVANGSNFALLTKENIWLHSDHPAQQPRMYAFDYSGYYIPLPVAYGGTVTAGGRGYPRPIVIGEYASTMDGGPVSLPPRHTWESSDTEVRPDTMFGAGGLDGVGLTGAQRETFKVVRTAAHFECLGFFDCMNAYDDVTISFGPCHWTLARCSGAGSADESREMPAFLAYLQFQYNAAYARNFEVFGLLPGAAWPLTIGAQSGTYATTIRIQTESGSELLCGAGRQLDENRYCKTWHVYYRFQMACRRSDDMRTAMWDFSRIRVRDILDKVFVINSANRRVGDYVTSTKGVAMLLRWHIYRPAHLFRTSTPANPNHLQNILSTVIAAHPGAASQARENAVLQQLSTVGGPFTNGHLTTIQGWTNVPQQGLAGYPHYRLNLAAPTLSATLNSFDFDAP